MKKSELKILLKEILREDKNLFKEVVQEILEEDKLNTSEEKNSRREKLEAMIKEDFDKYDYVFKALA